MPVENQSKKIFQSSERTAREGFDVGAEAAVQATKQAERSYSSAAEGIRELNVRLMDMTQVNATAALEFVRELMTAKGPKEAFEVWSNHTNDQFQRLTAQSRELAQLMQRIATSSAQPLSGEQGFKRTSSPLI
jgi:hypothetical protein